MIRRASYAAATAVSLFALVAGGAVGAADQPPPPASPAQSTGNQPAAGQSSDQSSPDQSLVAKGAYLAKAGDCEACHTTPGHPSFSGGEAIDTPMGSIYPPNITPDKKYGIGAWTDEQFYHTMHDGIGKDGEFLYPAFPYLWFARITRDDVQAIRAYLNTVPPAAVPSKHNTMIFPFNVRLGIAGWNLAFFHTDTFKPDPKKSPEWNRGAYLVEGLGHCGDCHTPKNPAMAPDNSRAFAGGDIDNWYAPNITSDLSEGIGKWSVDELATLFKNGSVEGKGVVVGKMAQVVHESLTYLTDQDRKAIAIYLKDLPPQTSYDHEHPSAENGPHAAGAAVFVSNCASCHQLDGKGIPNSVPALAGNGLVTAKAPDDVIRVIIGGHLATGTYSPMPAPGEHLTDQQIADVADYVRTAWGNAAPVASDTGLVAEIRKKTITTISGVGGKMENSDPCFTGDTLPVPPISDAQIDQTLAQIKPETMLPSIPGLIARVRQIDPKRDQADTVNGLTLAYCRVEQKSGALDKPDGRPELNQFSMLVYSELTSKGHE